MSNITISSEELSLVKQNNQRRYVKIQVLNRSWQSIGIIQGRLISCNVSIDGSSDVQRTASISMETESDFLEVPFASLSIDLQRDMPANYYIKLWGGIEDNNTLRVYWYPQGVFIVGQSGYSFDPKTRTLNLSLVDLMVDLNGERGGELHAYTSIVKNQQRIDDVMKNVMQLVGIDSYSIEPITVLRDISNTFDSNASEKDYMIPYDMNFSAGVTAYEILSKLVGLYPYYEMGFDVNGVFFVRKERLEQDDSYAILDAVNIADLVITEDTTLDWNYIRNHIEVWGKDGLYYGEADDNTAGSPFQVSSTPLRRLVIKDNEEGIDTNTICDRYINDDKQKELLTQQAKLEEEIVKLSQIKNPTASEQQELALAKGKLSSCKEEQQRNVSISGNDLAKQWAERKLYDRTRLQDSVTIKTVLMPFLNDVNFKISYRSQVDKMIRPYVVKSIEHDFAGGTTTLNMIRFYNDNCSNFWTQLGTPEITSAQVVDLGLTVTVENVEFAETYDLYIDRRKVGTFTSNTITYLFREDEIGRHTVNVVAQAPYYRASEASNTVTVVAALHDFLITDDGYYLLTDMNDRLIIDD